jgi:lipopolysaccharide biosynthesis protein
MTVAAAPAAFPSEGRRLIVYTMDDRRGGVEDSVLFALESLREHAARLLVVAEGSLTREARDALEEVADEVIVRHDVTSALWAYRAALVHLGDAVSAYDEVVLTSDRWFGPLHPFGPVFETMARKKLDLWGLLDRRSTAGARGRDKRDGVVSMDPRWIAARRRVIASDAWERYWRTLPPHPHDGPKEWLIGHDLTRSFTEAGFRTGAAFPEEDYPSEEPGLFNAELLIADGCPIVTRDVFDGYPLFLDQHAILGRRIAQAVATTTFPMALLWRNLARTLPPKRLNTNAAMFEVLSDVARTAPDAAQRILVVIHVPEPSGIDEAFSRVAFIPGDLHVVATVADSGMTDEVRTAWEASGVDGAFEIRDAAGRRGPDTAAVFAECADLLTSGDYALTVALHTGAPAGRVRNAVRYFRRQQFESLLNSPGHVANVLGLFAKEPGLGLVFPPTPHIGMSELGAGWSGHRERAERVAKRLGFEVPFDWASPHAPLGGMWIGRPEAVRSLAGRAWPADDPALIEVLKRLPAYAAGEAGFHTRTVSTGMHAGLSHGSLEYTLDHLSMTSYGYPAGYIGMLHKAGPMGSGRGRDLARMYLRFRRPGVLAGLARATPLARRVLTSLRSVRRAFRRAGGLR